VRSAFDISKISRPENYPRPQREISAKLPRNEREKYLSGVLIMNNIKMICYDKNFLRKSAQTTPLPRATYRAGSAKLPRNQREITEIFYLFHIN
jgi:hypothetical protein